MRLPPRASVYFVDPATHRLHPEAGPYSPQQKDTYICKPPFTRPTTEQAVTDTVLGIDIFLGPDNMVRKLRQPLFE